MDAQIAIPDLDDDTIYNLNNDDSLSSAVHDQGVKPRPFRGAELNNHSRSGSAVSGDSSNGSRAGTAPLMTTTGSGSASGSRFVGPGSNHHAPPSSSSGFPRKGSFASLKAAIKGQTYTPPHPTPLTSLQDAYPPQLRNPFHAGPTSDPRSAPLEGSSRIHSRNESIASSASRFRAVSGYPIQMAAYPRHMQQASLHSDHSQGLSVGKGSSLGDSTSMSIGASSSMPPVPPFPDAYTASSAPPAKTAYARSLSNRAYPGTSGIDDEQMMAPMPPFAHYRTGSYQSSADAHPVGHNWALPGTVGGYMESDTPLLPPPPIFADSHRYGRGSSGGSIMTSEDGNRPSLDQIRKEGHSPIAIPSQRSKALAASAHPQRQFFQSSFNSSQATLPSGVGLEQPVTPSEYAINFLCSRFLTHAGVRIRAAMGGVDEIDPSLTGLLGPKADPKLDALLDNLAHVSRKNAKPVIDSFLRWRASQLDEMVDMGEVRGALAGSQAGLSLGVKDIVNVLTRRKVLSTAFLLSRALSQVASHFVPGPDGRIGGLSEAHTGDLQSASFELMRECSRERIPASKMQSEAFDATTKLLGILSKSGFVAIGDRFVVMLEQCEKAAPAIKDGDPAIETTIQAMCHLSITPYPMELFEEGAEFLEVVARHFAAAHGQRIKSAYAESLAHLLLPVAKSATAELHHPTWIKALDSIAPRALAMLSKPRYWSVAYPLYVSVLCVSPEDRFLQAVAGSSTSSSNQSQNGMSWFACLEAGVAKLNKDKSVRSVVLDAAVRLLWTYIFRCRESNSTTFKRLESFFRLWFPLHRTSIFPADVGSIDAHVVMVHLALYRHFEFGRDLVLDFLRHQVLSGNTLSLQPELLSKLRMTIATRAILLSLDSYVIGKSPALPIELKLQNGKGGLGDELPDLFTYPRPEIEKAQLQFNDLIGKIALLCDHQVGSITIFDEQVTLHRGTSVTSAMASHRSPGDEERIFWKAHTDSNFVAAYSKEHQPTMDLLRACFDAWPRCLSSSISFSSVLSVLFRAHYGADPELAEAASQCLRRIARQRKGGATAVVSGFMRSVFRQETLCWEHHSSQLLILSKVDHSIKLWIEVLNIWFHELRKTQSSLSGQKGGEMERTSAWPIIDEVEAIGLSLLCSAWRPLRIQALEILRMVAKLDDVFVTPSAKRREWNSSEGVAAEEEEPTRVVHLLDMPCSRFIDDGHEGREDYAEMTAWERTRTRKWKRGKGSKETLGDLAASDQSNELSAWFLVIPRFLRTCLEHFPTTVAVFRAFVTTRVLWMDTSVSMAAGTSNRFQPATSTGSTLKGQSGSGISMTSNASGTLSTEQSLMAEHWKMYILALCTTTTSIEGQNRGKGEYGDRSIVAKDLFQKLVPFMASDHVRFRDAVVSSLGNINVNLYKTLLETMQTVSKQLSEDFKTTRTGARRSRRHERLRTAVANVIQLTSPHMVKVMSEQSVIFLLLQWIKESFNFLTDKEIRGDWEFHRLRRFFAGVVEEFFNSLHSCLSQDATERYLTFETKLRMFRLFREWHSYSQAAKEGPSKLANLLATVAEQYREDRNRENVLTLLRNETQLLSFHASSAMAALCQGVITLVGSAVPAPMSGSHLDTDSLLDWLNRLFISPSPQNHAVGRRALRALLLHNVTHEDLVTKTTDLAFGEAEQTTASRSFFAVLADVLIEKKDNSVLSLPQILCLGLIKLGHSDSIMRKKAFALLSNIVPNKEHLPSLHVMEGGVSSPLPATYLRAQRDVSTTLAERLPELKVVMLCEYTRRLPSIDLIRRATTLGLLPEWLHQIELVAPGYDSSSVILPRRATLVLGNLLSLTIKYGDEHNFEIQDMWASLAEGPQLGVNASIVVKFLIQQALYLRSSVFITHAKRAVSCLGHTILSPLLFSELCAYIEPSSMIPVPLELESMSLSDPDLDHLHLANIEMLLPPPSRKQTFSPGQVAALLVGELTYEKSYLLLEKLPLLLHAIFMNVDSLSPFTQEQVMAMFEQLLRSLSSEHGSLRAAENDIAEVDTQVDQLFAKGPSIFWTHEDIDLDLDSYHTPRIMRSTILDTLSILHHIYPDLNEQWGNVALFWATSNPVRHLACRSFQAFRILLPKINYTMLADMLGRLSNTISDSTRIDNQTFALEILYTIRALVQSIDAEERQSSMDLLCHVFWMNIACLSTVNEAEFCQSVGLMHALLDRIDLDNEETIRLLRAKCPDGWEGEMGGIQSLVIRGLKSASSSGPSFRLLARLAKIRNDQLIDHHDSRVGFLFLALLPWFLQMTDDASAVGESEEFVMKVAEDLADMAAKNNKADVERVATSIAKKRFRTKDDLIRQAINCCTRAGFLPHHATGAAQLLLGLTFNSQEWLGKQVLQILKLFFQSVDTKREDFSALGSELLMPLLRLLNGNLGLQALEVLEENIILIASSSNAGGRDARAGPSPQQIIRMSLQWGAPRPPVGARRKANQRGEVLGSSNTANEVNSLFGQPEDSGWSIPNVQDSTTRTRINILSVFKSVELLLDTPPVGEVNFVDDYDVDENIFETTMTASRNGVEDEGEDGRSVQAIGMQTGAPSSSVAAREIQSSSSSLGSGAMAVGMKEAPVDLGDIVSQLHDLSSFFVDGDPMAGGGSGNGVITRTGHSMQASGDGGSSSNHEQIAKILSRRAMTHFGGVLAGGSSSSGSVGDHGRHEAAGSIAESMPSTDASASTRAESDGISPQSSASKASKRVVGVWGRKSLFGGRRSASSHQNDTSKTTPTADKGGQIDAKGGYFALPEA